MGSKINSIAHHLTIDVFKTSRRMRAKRMLVIRRAHNRHHRPGHCDGMAQAVAGQFRFRPSNNIQEFTGLLHAASW